MNSKLFVSLALATLAGSTGCSTTLRSMTATSWIAPPGSTAGKEASDAVQAPPAEGKPAPTAGAPPGGIVSHYYLTYWEGTCSGFTGCSRGDTKVKHCKVSTDNSLTCNDEASAAKALRP